MKKEVRNQIEEFIKYNIELRRLSEENFADKRAKDIVSFWIHEINFELYSMQTMGVLYYDTSKLAYGIDSTKLDLNELSNIELELVLNYYWRKGYTLNRYDNIIMEKPDIIVIDWSKPQKQKLHDKMYILKFEWTKFKKFFNMQNKANSFFYSIFLAMKDFYWYYIWNNSYCISAIKAYRKSLKSKKVIKRREKIFKRVLKIKQKFNK